MKFHRKPVSRTPGQILLRVIFSQTIIVAALMVACGILTRFYLRTQFTQNPQENGQDLLQSFDHAMGLLFSIGFLILTVSAHFLAKKLAFPIGRMLIEAKTALNRESPLHSPLNPALNASGGSESRSEIKPDSYREWSDLENSFEEIRSHLESKIQNLKTEREEQATLMSAISDAILAVDPDEIPLFYNSRFALLFGDQRLHTHQKLWETFIDPEVLSAFRVALKSGKSSSVKAIPIDDATGRRFFSLSVSPLKQGQNQIYGAVGVFHDVTDLKRAEQIRIDFVANVSHELRTPLTAIKGYADTLLLDCRENKPIVPEFLEVIARNTDRLMNLINDLLDLSSLESKDTLHKNKINTEEVTSRILKQMKGAFELKRHMITVENLAPSVSADPRRLEQVLVNLLDNANKYTPPEGQITIRWEPAQENSTLLTIRNTGQGIPTEHHTRLFERFYRVDKARSREQGGTGLGLAIVKHIMQRHHGSVWVESESGQETAFLCRFP